MGQNIIIADDNTYMRDAMRAELERNGFSVNHEIDNGKDLVNLTLSLASHTHSNIAIVDVRMPYTPRNGEPYIDGLEATRLIRAHESENPSLKPAIIGIHSISSSTEEAKIVGANLYLPKGACSLAEFVREHYKANSLA